ncbi:ankyrin repeat domain-containing protein [Holophaga foetida]|uniref:ankyrin repeat domain-containing protein n=1 Tax=Holophaga foetida TaxID=35839 RepID=UPI0002471D15|nr:ankyrin repeat domain-containing protein [Holophaga foetida]
MTILLQPRSSACLLLLASGTLSAAPTAQPKASPIAQAFREAVPRMAQARKETQVAARRFASKPPRRNLDAELWDALEHKDGVQALALTGEGARAAGQRAETREEEEGEERGGWTALMLLADSDLGLSEDQEILLAQRLFDGGSPLGKRKDRQGSALTLAMARGKWKLVDWILATGGEDLSATRETWESGDPDFSPLGMAMQARRPELFRRLLKAGADPEVPDAQGATALLHAAGQPEYADILLAGGAKASVRDKEQRGMVEYAVMAGASLDLVDRWAKSAAPFQPHPGILAMAARSRSPERVLDLLARKWGNPDAADKGQPPALILCARRNRLDLVEALLKAGASPALGQTPLQEALKAGHLKVALRLLQCPDYDQGILASWQGGFPYLATACGLEAEPENADAKRDVIRLLIARGVSPDEVASPRCSGDEVIHTARELAEACGFGGLMPQGPSAWARWKDAPVLDCLTGAPIPPGAGAPRRSGQLPPLKTPRLTRFHPKNTRHSPEIGVGPFGYQFRLAPDTPYRLFSKDAKHEIQGTDHQGVLFDTTDSDGYTRFVRMPHPIKEEDWCLCEVIGELDGRFGSFFNLVNSDTGDPLPDSPYALEHLPAGGVYFGRSGKDGMTAYLMGRQASGITLFASDFAFQSLDDQILFKADHFWRRKGHLQENLRQLEWLFQENGSTGTEQSTSQSTAQLRSAQEGEDESGDFAGEQPRTADEIRKVHSVLRASRAAFLVANDRTELAGPDLDYLVACPSLPKSAQSQLEFLGERLAFEPRGRILGAIAKAMAKPESAVARRGIPDRSCLIEPDDPYFKDWRSNPKSLFE